MSEQSDRVSHPLHYGGDTPYETIKVIEAWGLNFHLGNAVKYLSRAGKKEDSDPIEDLCKAVWYIQREITQRLLENYDAKAQSVQNRQQSRTSGSLSTTETGERSVPKPRAGADSSGAEPMPHRSEARRDLHSPDICTVRADFCRETHEDAVSGGVNSTIR